MATETFYYRQQRTWYLASDLNTLNSSCNVFFFFRWDVFLILFGFLSPVVVLYSFKPSIRPSLCECVLRHVLLTYDKIKEKFWFVTFLDSRFQQHAIDWEMVTDIVWGRFKYVLLLMVMVRGLLVNFRSSSK